MGYTHYWTPKPYCVNESKWKDFIAEVKELKAALPKYSESAGGSYGEDAKNWKRTLKIRGGSGSGKAIINQNEVCFNGDEKRNLNHETFYITPQPQDWNFCKTARKPYDLFVCVVLLAAHNHLDYEVRSDGNLDDWMPAIELYSEVVYGGKDTIMNFEDDLLNHVLPKFLYEGAVA